MTRDQQDNAWLAFFLALTVGLALAGFFAVMMLLSGCTNARGECRTHCLVTTGRDAFTYAEVGGISLCGCP